MKRDGLSFTARLNAWFAGVVIVLSVLLFLASYLLLYRAVVQQDRAVVQAQWEVCRAWYEEGGLATLTSRLQENETGSGELFFVRVAGAGGAGLLVSIPKHAAGLDLSPLQAMTHEEAVAWLTLPSHNHGDAWLAITERLPDGSWLQVGKTTEAQTALLSQFRRVFGWVALIALVLGMAGGAWLTRRALVPIRALIDAVQNLLVTGRFSERMPLPEAHDDINRLARLFSTMLEKNDILIRGMGEALDNVAHELRTPLTRLRDAAELALEGEPDPQKSRDALLDSLEETDRGKADRRGLRHSTGTSLLCRPSPPPPSVCKPPR